MPRSAKVVEMKDCGVEVATCSLNEVDVMGRELSLTLTAWLPNKLARQLNMTRQ